MNPEWHTLHEKHDCAKRLGDPQNNPEVLRISNVRESLNRLWTT
jgi:hypothetical protein